MANPPPARPWFRLTSIRPIPAPAPAPAPESRPTLALPTFRTASAPPSPQSTTHSTQQSQEKREQPPPPSSPPKVFPSSSSLPSSPIQKPSSSLHSTPSSPHKTTTANIHSPKTIKQAVGSSQMPPSPPPSPLTLPPPAQLLKTTKTAEEPPKIPPTHHDIEAEPKAMVVQKTIVDNPKSWHNELHRESRNHSTNNPPTHHHNNHNNGKEILETKKEKKVVVSDDHHDHGNMRVITIAGENRGAYMELINSAKKHQPNFLHSKIKEESEESLSEKKKDYEVKGRMKRSSPMAGAAAAAYMNSNVQCVNNSLLYHTCFSHHDPGVRLSLSKKPLGLGLGDADDDDDAAAAAARKDRNTTN